MADVFYSEDFLRETKQLEGQMDRKTGRKAVQRVDIQKKKQLVDMQGDG